LTSPRQRFTLTLDFLLLQGFRRVPTPVKEFAAPRSITLDVNAAGYGWFIDATPLDDSECASGSRLSARYRASWPVGQPFEADFLPREIGREKVSKMTLPALTGFPRLASLTGFLRQAGKPDLQLDN